MKTSMRQKLFSSLLGIATIGASIFCTSPASDAQDGRSYVVYSPAKSKFGKTLEAEFKKSKGLEQLAAGLTSAFKFPRDLPIIMAETGEPNCWYDPELHRLTLSYEFVEFLAKLFQQEQSLDEAADNAGKCFYFTILHELGHAVINEFELPITGREEDAADEFAVLMLNSQGKEGQEYAISAATWFELMSRRTSNKDLPFWDEHSLDKQRFFDIFSLLYGSDPNRFIFVEKIVPRGRLKKSLRDFKRKEKAWDKLLEPYVRTK